MDTRMIHINPQSPDRADLQAVSGRLRDGGICILPTDTIYGFHCRFDDEDALRTIQDLKARPEPQPMVVLLPGMDTLRREKIPVPPGARLLMERFWPGPLTIVVPVTREYSPWLTGGRRSLAVRQPGYPMLNVILADLDVPIVSTSVNISGESPLLDIDTIITHFSGKVPCIVNAGPPAMQTASTIVSFVEDPPRFLRVGAIPTPLVNSVLGLQESRS
ncbi:MAG: threonylcarbamoyl-AMP synthase [Acidobacteria bacterium]|nr:threonylcarbamoyl-AMP synthase [Acidobacteriota bacterium]